MSLIIRAEVIELTADADPSVCWNSSHLEIIDPDTSCPKNRWDYCVPAFQMMRDAITSDIQNPEGSGAAALKAIQKVESGESAQEELGGNAWSTYITPQKVWFEGYYNQGEGGEVSLAQYKLAVQTYVRFLSDPEQKCIEVAFPAE
jgi:hypothetical protein